MIDRQMDEEKIFHIARGIESPELREDYLTQICSGDQPLKERVEALLDAFENEQSLLKSKVVVEPTVEFSDARESVGTQVGRFKLLQKIGEGGFGVVYMAEQSRPVRRKVALKIIKPGMDTRAVVARFEAERQALALMDHTNIAKVFDGGTTEAGRPYFVMELVKGVPITQFCDENKFTLKQRLELFATVCQAIQHAHQKGIIHRDIKPSNVLVTLHDGVPVPKVIDFGISKAISQQLTEKTLFTAHGQMIGTPQYMSPEQAEISGLDVDTRSDIYSLGIVLYELLTGCTPLDPVKIRETAYNELQRMIREDEPLSPSRRYSTMGKQSVAIANNRHSDPQKLGGQLRGELDLIVMKSLEKDRNRRYASATEFADDIQRFLCGDTVQACPPSAAYRFQKFARKNRSLLLTGSLIAGILLIAAVASSILAYENYQAAQKLQEMLADKERMLKQIQQARTYKQQVAIDRAVVSASIGNFKQARAALASVELDEPRAYQLLIQGLETRFDGDVPGAIPFLEEAHQLQPNDVIIESTLAMAYLTSGNWESYAHSTFQRDPETLESDYERLAVGHALIWSDPELGLELLNEAAENLRHPLAYVYRALTLASLANGSRNIEDMEAALRDADMSKGYLPANEFSLTWQLYIHELAHDLYLKLAREAKAKGDTKEVERLQSRAEELLHELDAIFAQFDEVGSYGSQGVKGRYYRIYGDSEQAREYYRGTNQGQAVILGYTLNHPSEFDSEIKRLSRPEFAIGRANLCRLILMLQSEKIEPDDEEINRYLEKASDKDLGWVIDLALIAGRWQEAEELALNLYEKYPKDGNRIRVSFLAFQAGKITAEEYLSQVPKLAKGGAYYEIGVNHLGRGDRDEAKQYFQDSVDYGLPDDRAKEFAAVFLEQFEKDSNWPSWIPVKSQSESVD